MNKAMLLISILLVLLLVSCQKDTLQQKYPGLKDNSHILLESDAQSILKALDNEDKTIIVFSFPSCPWCQAAIPYVNEIAKEKEYKQVLYLDIKNMRDDEADIDHETYLKIYERIRYDITNPDKINAPTVIVVEKKEVIGFHIDTVSSHVKNENNILEPLTKEQIEELKEIYRNLF